MAVSLLPPSVPGPVGTASVGGSNGSLTPKPGLNFARMLQRIEAAPVPPLATKRPFGGTKLSLTSPAAKKTRTSKKTSVAVDWAQKFEALRRAPQPWHWIIGIDMSLTNPGLCLLNPQLRLIHLFGFRNRIKETNSQTLVNCPESVFHQWVLRTTVIEEWPDPEQTFPFSLPRLARYEARIQSLLGLIGHNHQGRTIVGLEHYAFAAGATRGDSTLKELGGILRRELCHRNHRVIEIVPSQVKRIFCQKGDAKKKDMYRAYRELYRLPDLMQLLNIRASEPLAPRKKKQKTSPAAAVSPRVPKTVEDVSHPVEDMVDALAVALAVIAKQES